MLISYPILTYYYQFLDDIEVNQIHALLVCIVSIMQTNTCSRVNVYSCTSKIDSEVTD